jgi:predicted small metal-binding protein
VVGIAGRDCNWVARVESGEEKEKEILVGGDGDAGAVGFFVMGCGFFIKVAASLQWGIWRDTLHFFVCRYVCLSPST